MMTCGLHMQGAVDDLDRVLALLQEHGYSEDRFYIHCDGALFGLMVRSPCGQCCKLHPLQSAGPAWPACWLGCQNNVQLW